MSKLTVADLRQCTMVQTTHLNGGREFFGYVFACVEHPRLQRMDKYWRKTRTMTIEYRVDGIAVTSLDEAAERLNLPPTMTDEQRAAFDKVGADYEDHRKTIGYELLRQLADRNLIEWDSGKVRRTAYAMALEGAKA